MALGRLSAKLGSESIAAGTLADAFGALIVDGLAFRCVSVALRRSRRELIASFQSLSDAVVGL